MYSTDRTMGHQCEVHIFDIRDSSQMSKWTLFAAELVAIFMGRLWRMLNPS